MWSRCMLQPPRFVRLACHVSEEEKWQTFLSKKGLCEGPLNSRGVVRETSLVQSLKLPKAALNTRATRVSILRKAMAWGSWEYNFTDTYIWNLKGINRFTVVKASMDSMPQHQIH